MATPENTNKELTINKEVAMTHLWSSYSRNPELIELEKVGLLRGLRRGKTDNVPLESIQESLSKQYHDWIEAYISKDIPEMKRTLADLRNVAGIIFLKLKEAGDKKE